MSVDRFHWDDTIDPGSGTDSDGSDATIKVSDIKERRKERRKHDITWAIIDWLKHQPEQRALCDWVSSVFREQYSLSEEEYDETFDYMVDEDVVWTWTDDEGFDWISSEPKPDFDDEDGLDDVENRDYGGII